MSIKVKVSGPLYDGRAELAAKDAVDKIKDKLAQWAEKRVVEQLGESIRHNTGRYISSIHIDHEGQHAFVHDRFAFVYGPWLEGTGSKNLSTRFKGYHAMRKVRTELSQVARPIADEVLHEYLPEMN